MPVSGDDQDMVTMVPVCCTVAGTIWSLISGNSLVPPWLQNLLLHSFILTDVLLVSGKKWSVGRL